MFRFLITCILIASLGMGFACSSGEEPTIRETIYGFWDAYNAGDHARMTSYCESSLQISATFWLESQRVKAGIEPAVLAKVGEIRIVTLKGEVRLQDGSYSWRQYYRAYAEVEITKSKQYHTTITLEKTTGDWKIITDYGMDFWDSL